MKILLSTAWWPTHSICFKEYSNSIINQFHHSFKLDFFITTNFAEQKFDSIVKSMLQAEKYALNNNYDYLFNVEADVFLQQDTLFRILDKGKDVIILTQDNTTNKLHRLTFNDLNKGLGWGCILINTSILKIASFKNAYTGGFNWPDRNWFKYLLKNNIKAWIDRNEKIIKLLPSSKIPKKSFS